VRDERPSFGIFFSGGDEQRMPVFNVSGDYFVSIGC
jgi:hypothetical protein